MTARDGGLSLTACWLMGSEDPQAVSAVVWVAEPALCSGSSVPLSELCVTCP